MKKKPIVSWTKFNEEYDGFAYNDLDTTNTDETPTEEGSIWSEIRTDFIDEEANVQYIDAYVSGDDNEEGKVIATINLDTKVVSYKDERAKTDEKAQEAINNALADLGGDDNLESPATEEELPPIED